MTTITQTITALPTAPNPNTPSTFNTLAYPFTVAVAAMGPEQNTMATQMNTVAGEVNTNATTALASSVSAAASSAVAVAIANYAGAWSLLTGAKTVPLSVDHLGVFWILLSNIADVTAEVPGVSNQWGRAYGNGVVYERTSNSIIVSEDNGKVIKVTSGTFSQTFTAAATLGAGHSTTFWNAGTGVLTLDPNGAELIDGAATKTVTTGQIVTIFCTGTAFTTVVSTAPVGDHSVVAKGNGGHGSTNTQIRRFTAAESSTGTAITYADSAGNGGTFTINETGLYSISYSDSSTIASTVSFGLSLNSAQLTTSIASITATARLGMVTFTGGADAFPNLSVTERFAAGDIIRAHTIGTSIDGAATLRIRKVGIA